MKDSTPLAQVVPGRGIAGFDMIWNASSLGKFKRTFCWSVNGHRLTSVNVMGEVIPIELQLSSTNLTMEFPSDSLEKSCSEELVLTNTTNACANFVWSTEGAFLCKPERGVVDPGQSLPITVNWTPHFGIPNYSQLKLHITEGVEAVVNVTANFGPEPKAAFETKQCELGIVAIGMETKFIAKLKNVASCPLVFRIDRLQEALGIVTFPDRGRILPGDTFNIDVVVRPTKVVSYDTISIVAHIRGGKATAVKCCGQSVVPDVTLLEESFSFGTVILGSQSVLPFNIRNNSAVCPASMLLDLSEHRDFKPIFKSYEGVLEWEGGATDALGSSIEDLSLKPGSASSLPRGFEDIVTGVVLSRPSSRQMKASGQSSLKQVVNSLKVLY